jgi:predicted lipoprotein with Yx(FWY)xxD motif
VSETELHLKVSSVRPEERKHQMFKTVLLAAAGIGALVAAGCSSSNPSPASMPASAGGHASTTVAVQNVSGVGRVLVDGAGHTLYESEQEKSGMVLCSSSACTAIWSPLTVSAGQKPSGPSSVSGKLATVSRSDGKAQVTLNGAPLYTFSFDNTAGEAKGNGQSDSFDGTSFTWHAATPTGVAAAKSTAPNSGGGYGGGYG